MFKLDQTLPIQQQAQLIAQQMKAETLRIVWLSSAKIGALIYVLSQQLLVEKDQEKQRIYEKYVKGLSVLKMRKQNIQESGCFLKQIQDSIKNSDLIKAGGLFYEGQNWTLEEKARKIVKTAQQEMCKIKTLPSEEIKILIRVLIQQINQEQQQEVRRQYQAVLSILYGKEMIFYEIEKPNRRQQIDTNMKTAKKQQQQKHISSSNVAVEEKPKVKKSFFSKAFESSRKVLSKVKSVFEMKAVQANDQSEMLLLPSQGKEEL